MMVRLKAVVLLFLLALSGCSDFNLAPEKDLKSQVKDKGYSLIIYANKGGVNGKLAAGAQFFNNGQAAPIEGGNVVTVKTDIEEALLNKFGDTNTDYAASANISSTSNTIRIGTKFLPIKARAERFYPADILHVKTTARDYVGFAFDATFPEPLVVSSPMPDSVFRNHPDSTDVMLQWQRPSNGNQIEVSAYVHCTKQYKVIYRGEEGSAELSKNVNLGKILKESQDFASVISRVLEYFVVSSISLGLIDPDFNKPERVSECDIDLYFKNIQYDSKDITREAGVEKTLRRITAISASKKVSIKFKSDTPYEL